MNPLEQMANVTKHLNGEENKKESMTTTTPRQEVFPSVWANKKELMDWYNRCDLGDWKQLYLSAHPHISSIPDSVKLIMEAQHEQKLGEIRVKLEIANAYLHDHIVDVPDLSDYAIEMAKETKLLITEALEIAR